ncbi:protein FAM200A [Trichonephila clavata]|uniref:Protein FAM200A n=1 Tax=Trichonephila clavata TaxID=2740835 RepID=A0A8X6LFY3_TRICU|nr:protein FAM200A [Trichonephila clavata]
MQGQNENILTCSDKLQGFIKKLELWQKELQKGCLEMYQRTNHITIENKHLIVDLAQQHLSMLQQKFDQYFYSINTEQYDWIRNPFATNAINSTEALPLQIPEEFTDLNNDMTLKLYFSEVPLDVFWIYVKKEYPHISYKAILTLLPFSTTYLCKQSFSTLVLIKNDKRSCLEDLYQELRVALSNIEPNIKLLCSLKQAQVSH